MKFTHFVDRRNALTHDKIAANKQDRDGKIGEILSQLCKHYSRFPTLERIHPTQEMKECLAEAYRVGIEFARYASLYFLKSSIGRLWSVIYAPPERFDEELSKITDSMEAIKDEIAFRDSERLYRVEAALEENTARLEASQREIQGAWTILQGGGHTKKLSRRSARCPA